MTPADLVPAVLFYYDRAGKLQRAETNAEPLDCDAVSGALYQLERGRPTLVLAGDADAVLAALREGGSELMRARPLPGKERVTAGVSSRRKFLVGAAAGRSVPDSRGGSGRYRIRGAAV